MQCHSRNDLKAAKQFFEHINTIEPYSIAWFFSAETNQERLKKFCTIAKDCIGKTMMSK